MLGSVLSQVENFVSKGEKKGTERLCLAQDHRASQWQSLALDVDLTEPFLPGATWSGLP